MQIAMVSLYLLLFPTLVWAGTLRDDFSDGNLDGWTFIKPPDGSGQWKIEEGKLVVTNPSDFGYILVIGEDNWKDYSIECEATLHTKFAAWSLIGLELHVQMKPPQEWQGAVWMGYGFRPDRVLGAHMTVADDANWLQDVTNPMLFEIGRIYHLKGVVSGNKYQFYIDKELVLKSEDNHFPSGKTDLMVNGAIASFDNVVITGDDVPDKYLSVKLAGKLAEAWGWIRSVQ